MPQPSRAPLGTPPGWPRAPVFVVGPPRSGTTVVRVTLSRHPDLSLTNETHLFDQWVRRHPGLTAGDRGAFEVFWEAFTAAEPFAWHEVPAPEVRAWLDRWERYDAAAVMAALLAAVAERDGVARAGEKTPAHALHLPELLAAFPDAAIVYTVRDPRGCVASELRHDADWAATEPEAAASRWRQAARPLLAWRDDPRVHVVRYEDLVLDPRRTLADTCRAIGIADDPERITELLDDPGGHPTYQHGDLDPWGPVDPGSLGAWRDQLDAVALEAVDHHCRLVAGELGYPAPTGELGAVGRIRVAGARLLRWVRRILRLVREVAA